VAKWGCFAHPLPAEFPAMKARSKATARPRTKADFLRRMGAAATATTWWWMNEADESKRWPDLHRALDALKEARIDLADERHLAFVLAFGKRHTDFEKYRHSEHWLRDKRDLETLDKLYRVVLRTKDLNNKGQAEQVRQRILGELLAEKARLHDRVGPPKLGRGRPVDWDLRGSIDEKPPGYFLPGMLVLTNAPDAAVEAAQDRRIVWGADAIAAVLFLTGVRRESFEALKRAIRAMVRRVEHFNEEVVAIQKRKQRSARKS
jgi:hypothetical protein